MKTDILERGDRKCLVGSAVEIPSQHSRHTVESHVLQYNEVSNTIRLIKQ